MRAPLGMTMKFPEFYLFLCEQRRKSLDVDPDEPPLTRAGVEENLKKVSRTIEGMGEYEGDINFQLFRAYMLYQEKNALTAAFQGSDSSVISNEWLSEILKEKLSVAKEDAPVIEDLAGLKHKMSDRQKLFWNTTFRKKYGKFGSEPRSKVLRGIDKNVSKRDDGYLMNSYARSDWQQKDVTVNAQQPRPQIVSTFGILTSTPGPGEYANVSSGFENSSRFKNGGVPTVKSRPSGREKIPLTKTPKNLLDMKSPEEDSLTRIKRRIRQKRKEEKEKAEKGEEEPDESDHTVIKKDPFVKKIQRWNIEKLRSTLDDLDAPPGPNAYRDALTPFLADKMAVGMARGPTMAQMKQPSKPSRKMLDLNNEEDDFTSKLKFSTPGVGSYNLRGSLEAPSTLPLRGCSPVTKIHPEGTLSSPSKPRSAVGPGSYDVIHAMQATSPLSKVARSYQKADFGASHTHREFE